MVVDNEAGMEHLSRRTTRDVQHLLVVTDPTQRGMVAAERVAEFRHKLDNHIESAWLIVNRVRGPELPPALAEHVAKLDIPLLGTIPEAGSITEYEFSGRPLVELGDDSEAYRAVAAMMRRLAWCGISQSRSDFSRSLAPSVSSTIRSASSSGIMGGLPGIDSSDTRCAGPLHGRERG